MAPGGTRQVRQPYLITGLPVSGGGRLTRQYSHSDCIELCQHNAGADTRTPSPNTLDADARLSVQPACASQACMGPQDHRAKGRSTVRAGLHHPTTGSMLLHVMTGPPHARCPADTARCHASLACAAHSCLPAAQPERLPSCKADHVAVKHQWSQATLQPTGDMPACQQCARQQTLAPSVARQPRSKLTNPSIRSLTTITQFAAPSSEMR